MFFSANYSKKNKNVLYLGANIKTIPSTFMEGKNIQGYLKQLAEDMNASYTEYSDDTVIITFALEDARFQSVRGLIQEKSSGLFLILSSVICRLHEQPDVDFRKMLERNDDLEYSKITITDEDYLELTAHMRYDLVNPDELRYMLQEVATQADKLEHEITGKDHH